MEDIATWFTGLPAKQIKALGEQIDSQEFDHVFRVTANGVIEEPDYIGPDLYHDDKEDIVDNGAPMSSSEWTALTGYTGQYGYDGAVMHSSEYIGGRLAEDIISLSAGGDLGGMPLVWVVTSVELLDDDDVVGWAVLYREMDKD